MSKKCRSSIQKEELKGIGCISELVFVDVFPTSAFFPSGNLKEPEQEGFGWVWLGLVSLQSENSSAPISHLLRVFPIPVVSHGPPRVRSEPIPGWADPRSLPLTERRLGCSKGGALTPGVEMWECPACWKCSILLGKLHPTLHPNPTTPDFTAAGTVAMRPLGAENKQSDTENK